jgi:fibronectin type 3 domain-containing protein
MISRRVLRRLRSKTAVVTFVALVAVAALTLPNLAGAITAPSIDTPGNGASFASDPTFTFSMPNTDLTETGYDLLRAPYTGDCSTALGGATVKATASGPAPLDPAPLVDTSSPADGDYCYWVRAVDSNTSESAVSSPVRITYDTTGPTVPASFALVGATPRNDVPSFTFAASSDVSTPITYNLYRGATLVDSSTSLTLTDSLPLPPDGSYNYKVIAVDALDNAGTATSVIPVVIDTLSPTTPSLSAPTSPRTSAASFTVSGGTDLHAVTYQLYRAPFGGSPVAVGPATASTTLADPSLPADGTYTYTVVATDAAGNASASSAGRDVTYDTTAPTVPTGLALVSGSTPRKTAASISFTASSDALGPITYKLYRAGTLVDTSTTSPLSDPTVPGTDGSYDYTVVAVDAATNASAPSSALPVVFDTHAPTIPTALTLVGATPRKTAPSFTFTGSTDAIGPVTYQLYRGATPVGPPTAGTTIADPSVPSDGSYTYTIVALDGVGNTSAASGGVPVRLDTAAPNPAPTGLTLTGQPNPRSTGNPPSFSYSTSSDPSGVTYRLYRDNALTNVTSAGSTIVDTSIAMDGTADGTYSYTVTAVDSLSNESLATNSVSVTISAGAPSVPGGLRAVAAITHNPPVISWNASTGSPSAYRILRNGQQIGTVNAPSTTFTDSLPLDGSADGDYAYTVVAVDNHANASAESSPLHVVLDTTHPASAASLTAAASPTAAKPVLVWPASASSDVAGYNVYRGTTKINGAVVTTTSFTDSTVAGDGTYSYTVRTVDQAGNESADSTSATVLYDTTAPGTPGASAVAAATGGTASLSWAPVSDTGSGVVSYQVRRSPSGGAAPISLAEGTPVCGVLTTSATGCGDAGLTPGGSYRYSVFAIDKVGNVSMPGETSTISVPSTLDRTPPKAPTTLRAVVSNGQITLSWKNPKADFAGVSVILNAKRAPRSARDGSVVYHGSGAKVRIKMPKLSAGKLVRFAVFAADKAGNTSPAARTTVLVPKPSAVSLAPNGKLSGDPNLTWNAVTGATYYNVQVFEGTQASRRVGISWPTVTKWTLPGKDMKKGKVYTWYVWPGIGAKSAANYGKLIGKVTFTYTG